MSTSDTILASTNGPLVTIAIPTFNRASWLTDCLYSALSQTYQHFELLVSDNASTDETELVLRSFSDTRLRVIRQETNTGLGRNWNTCLENAKGAYIVFLSDDERLEPWLLERCIGLIKKEPQIDVVISLGNTHSTLHGQTSPAAVSQRLETGIWDGTDILLEYLGDQITAHMSSIMMRTDAARAQGGFRPDLPNLCDLALFLPLLLKGKAGFINKAGATSFSHRDNETEKLSVEQCLHDGWKVSDLISNLADRSLSDPRLRRSVQLHCRRHFTRRSIIKLYIYRRAGGNLLDVLAIGWRFRRHLSQIDLETLFRLRWNIAIIFCQKQMAWIRRLKRSVARLWPPLTSPPQSN